MRQSQQERRIAVQLMHVRHEKEVLKQNRIFREKQYEERRLKEFQEALDREAVSSYLFPELLWERYSTYLWSLYCQLSELSFFLGTGQPND